MTPILKWLGDDPKTGLVTIGREQWVRGKTRKETTCALTGKPIRKGDLAYRPLRDTQHRHLRILASEMENYATATAKTLNKLAGFGA